MHSLQASWWQQEPIKKAALPEAGKRLERRFPLLHSAELAREEDELQQAIVDVDACIDAHRHQVKMQMASYTQH